MYIKPDIIASILVVTATVSNSLHVQTSSGLVHGTINSSYPDVRQFLGIPYAKPPLDNLRWLPPQELNNDPDTVINGTQMPPACIQTFNPNNPFSIFAPSTIPTSGTSEDCLNLSIFAPNNDKENLPVIIWIHPGQFQVGGTGSPGLYPAPWIQRSQEHILVAIQWRLNMFGFPAARGLTEQNLGILDQRAGIEWVRDNIAQFGGNPNQMILWGESSGGGGVDIQNVAYPDDPIVQGFAMDSGSAFLTLTSRSTDVAGGNFSTVANHFSCSGSPQEELDCLRNVSASDIISFLGSDGKSLTFAPFPDEKVIFNNYTDQYVKNHLSSKPVLLGSNLDDGSIQAGGAPGDAAKKITLSLFQCPVPWITSFRESLGLTTYRYQYRGVFANLSPNGTGPGSFHTAELPLIFGTSAGLGYGTDTTFEEEVSRKMQDLWLAFAKDPQNGLQRRGWPESTNGDFLMFGGTANNQTIVSAVMDDSDIDDECKSYYSTYLA